MRNSQYLEKYLAQNATLGSGRGLTIGTYLSYNLHGRAKLWSSGYYRALKRSCEKACEQDRAIAGKSARGSVAYYPSTSMVAAPTITVCDTPQVSTPTP